MTNCKVAIYVAWVIVHSFTHPAFSQEPYDPAHSRPGVRDRIYKHELYQTNKTLKSEITSSEDYIAKETAALVTADARSNPKELIQLLYLSGKINNLGLVEANRLLDYSAEHCLEKAHPRNMDCERVDPYPEAVRVGKIAEEQALVPFSGQPPGLNGFVDAVGSPIKWFSPAKAVVETSLGNAKFYSERKQLQQTISPSGPSFPLIEFDSWIQAAENDLYNLFKNASKSESIKKYVDALGKKRHGKTLFSLTESDREPVTKGLRSSHRVQASDSRFEQWRNRLTSISPDAWKYAQRNTLEALTPETVFELYDSNVKYGLSPTDPYAKYSLLGRSGSPEKSNGHSLDANTNLDASRAVSDIKTLENMVDTFHLIGKLTPDKNVRAAAEIGKASSSIALAAAKGVKGMTLALNVLGTMTDLIGTLKSLLGGEPSMQTVLLERLGELEAKIDELIADTKNGLNIVIQDGKSLRQLLKQEVDNLKRLGHQSREEALDAQFHASMSFARILSEIKDLDWKRRIGNLEAHNTRMVSLIKAAEPPYISVVSKPQEIRERNQFNFFKEAINGIESAAIRYSGHSDTIGTDITARQSEVFSVEQVLADTAGVDGPYPHLSLLAGDLKKNFSIDLRPKAPSYLRQNSNYEMLELSLDGDRLSSPLSPRALAAELKRLHQLTSPRPDLDEHTQSIRSEMQCAVDPELKKIRLWLDVAINTRQSMMDVIPGDNILYVDEVIPLFLAYDKEIQDGAAAVTDALNRKLLDTNSMLKGYELGIPAAAQKLKSAPDSDFFFGDDNPEIFSCAKSDSEAMPTIPLLGHGVQIASQLIPNEYRVAKDLMGGSFRFCYDDVGPEKETVQLYEHGIDDPRRKSIVSQIHGNLGLTVRVQYKDPEGKVYEVNSVRITDSAISQQFIEREYLPVWRNFHPQDAVDLSKKSALANYDKNQTMNKAVAFAKSQESSLGEFLGFYPKLGMTDSSNWKKRFALLKDRLSSSGDAYALSLAKKEKSPFDKVLSKELGGTSPQYQKLLNNSRAEVSLAINRKISQLAAEQIKGLEKESKNHVGELATQLKRVDGSRARLISTLHLSLGDNFLTDPDIYRLVSALPSSSDLLHQVHIGGNLHNAKKAQDFVRGLQIKTRDLYNHLARTKFERRFEALDDVILKLVDLYWYQARLRPNCSLAQLPDAFNSKFEFKSEKELQNFLQSGEAYPYKLSRPRVYGPMNFASSVILNAPKLTIAEAVEVNRVVKTWEKSQMLPSIPYSSTVLEKHSPYFVTMHVGELVQELMHSESQTGIDVSSALKYLSAYRGELPTKEELKLIQTISKQAETDPGLNQDNTKKLLSDFSGTSADRTLRYKAILERAASDLEDRKNLIAKVESEIERWKLSADEIGKLAAIDSRAEDLKRYSSNELIAVANHTKEAAKAISDHFQQRVKMLTELNERIKSRPSLFMFRIVVGKKLERPETFHRSFQIYTGVNPKNRLQMLPGNKEITFAKREEVSAAINSLLQLSNDQNAVKDAVNKEIARREDSRSRVGNK
jgi:hypothetical protein